LNEDYESTPTHEFQNLKLISMIKINSEGKNVYKYSCHSEIWTRDQASWDRMYHDETDMFSLLIQENMLIVWMRSCLPPPLPPN